MCVHFLYCPVVLGAFSGRRSGALLTALAGRRGAARTARSGVEFVIYPASRAVPRTARAASQYISSRVRGDRARRPGRPRGSDAGALRRRPAPPMYRA